MAANFDVVVLSGPPYSGKSRYLSKHLQKSHTRICPQELFKENPKLGLRDVAVAIVKQLQKKSRVVVEDSNYELRAVRGYLRTVKMKAYREKLEDVPECKMAMVSLRPKYGKLQCQWHCQLLQASGNRCPVAHDDTTLAGWFPEGNLIEGFQEGSEEGVTVFTEETPLVAEVFFKMETPGLFLQWEGVKELVEEEKLSALSRVCQTWCRANPTGHVIVVHDGRTARRACDQKCTPEVCMKEIIQKMPCPMYLVEVEAVDATQFCAPPSPGILAFLQGRHHLSLSCRATTYLYHSRLHRDMADSAGIRHVKLSQCLSRAALVCSGGPAPPKIPPLLRSLLEELPSASSSRPPPDIPLFQQLHSFQDGVIAGERSGGKREWLFATNVEAIVRLNEAARKSATPVGEVSSLSQATQISAASVAKVTRAASAARVSRDAGSTSCPSLPAWMLPKTCRQESSSLEKSDSTGSSDGFPRRLRSMVYLMTERELMQMAEEVLQQAGQEEVLQRIKRQRQQKTERLDARETTPAEAPQQEGAGSADLLRTRGARAGSPGSRDTEPQTAGAGRRVRDPLPDSPPRKRAPPKTKSRPRDASKKTTCDSDGDTRGANSPTKTHSCDIGTGDNGRPLQYSPGKRPQPDASILDEIFL